MAHPPEFVADPRCILLSQSHGDIRRQCLEDHGCHAQLPFRRQRGGTGNGINRAFRNREGITAPKYHTLEGNATLSRIHTPHIDVDPRTTLLVLRAKSDFLPDESQAMPSPCEHCTLLFLDSVR